MQRNTLWQKLTAFFLVVAMVAACIPVVQFTTEAVSYDFKNEQVMTKESYTHTDDTVMPYRLHIPKDYDATKSYPVLLLLNGNGHQGTNNESQLNNFEALFEKQLLLKDAIIIAPQCSVGKRWVEGTWETGNYDSDVLSHEELDKVMRILQEVQNQYSTNDNRLYVCGLSMGGIGTWNLLMRYPDKFAAGIPVCGAADINKADVLNDIPIWTFHGTADETVPYDKSDKAPNGGTKELVEAIEAVNQAQGLPSKVKVTLYDGVAHFIWDSAFRTYGLVDWLFAQKLSDRYTEVGADYSAVNAIIDEVNTNKTSYTTESLRTFNAVADTVDWTLHKDEQSMVAAYAEALTDVVVEKAATAMTAEAAAAAVDAITYFTIDNAADYDTYQTALKGNETYQAQYDRVTNAIAQLADGYDFYDDADNLGDYKTAASNTNTVLTPLPMDAAVTGADSAYQILADSTGKINALGLGAANNSGSKHLMWSHTNWISLADKAGYEAKYGTTTEMNQIITPGEEITDFQISYNPYYNLRIIFDYIDENNYSYIWFRGNMYPRLTVLHIVNGSRRADTPGDGTGLWNYNQTIDGLTGDAEGGAPGRCLLRQC